MTGTQTLGHVHSSSFRSLIAHCIPARFTFFGTDEEFTAVAGGKGGGTAKIGREIATGLTEEQSIALARKVITF